MKILWLSHFYPYPPAGGALQRSYHLLRQVAERHEVHLVALRKTRDRPDMDSIEAEYPSPESFCERVVTFPIPAESTFLGRVLVLASGLWDRAPYDDRWLESHDLDAFLRSDIRREAFDLLHLDTIGLAQYGKPLEELPTVMNHHNIESHMMARRAEYARDPLRSTYMKFEARKLARWEQRWCGGYDRNLVVSRLDGERLERKVPDAKWSVVANGVDTDYFEPAGFEDRDRHGLVFVGRMSWYPNEDAVDWLLREIWPVLRSEKPGLTLTLVGSSPPSEVTDDSGLPGVAAPGFVPDVRPYMWNASIYICPIRTGGGTRLKILDAMAMGMPLVATGMSVEGLDLEEGRHYLRAERPREYLEAIERLECDEELRFQLGRNAREKAVRLYSWKRIGQRLFEVYETVVGTGASS